MAKTKYRFDFAISFAGAKRQIAREVRNALAEARFSVFFDEDYEHEMLGHDGSLYLRNVYAQESRYCIVLISREYDQRDWANLEREAIQSRELRGERGILIPVLIDGHRPTWLPETRIYFDISKRTIAELIKLLAQRPGIKPEAYKQKDPNAQKNAELEFISTETGLGEVYSQFWIPIRDYYQEFRRTAGVDVPEEIEELIGAAGPPPYTTDIGAELRTWPARAIPKLTSDQRRMWQFVQRIYPPRHPDASGDVWQHSALTPIELAKIFHDARRRLAQHFVEAVKKIGIRSIRERYASRQWYVYLLAWLEVALAQWTRQPGPGKQELYRLAENFGSESHSA